MKVTRVILFIPYIAIGLVMASIGYPYYTWQFWAVMMSVVTVDVISHIEAS